MAMTANRNVDHLPDQALRSYPVDASTKIYAGSYVGKTPAGYVKPFVPGDEFVGIAYEQKDNSAGAAAGESIRVYVDGDFNDTLTGVTEDIIGKALFATADNTLSTKGHPDAFLGRAMHKFATDQVLFRLKQPGEKPLAGEDGSIEFVESFAGVAEPTGIATGPTYKYNPPFTWVSALGLGVKQIAANDSATATSNANGGVDLEFDAVAEVAQASIESPIVLAVSGGVTLEAELHLPDIGTAALDVDFGLAGQITSAIRNDMDAAGLTHHARFHMDAAATAINAEADDNTVDVAATDTGTDNVTTAGAFKSFKIIVRPDGKVEFWIDKVRQLAATFASIALPGATLLGGFLNMEKTSDATTAKIRCRKLRVAGAKS